MPKKDIGYVAKVTTTYNAAIIALSAISFVLDTTISSLFFCMVSQGQHAQIYKTFVIIGKIES